MLQTTVDRNYTTGFVGSLVRGGPHRAKIARIVSATLGTDPGASTNRISRAFGYTSEQGIIGGTTPQTGVMPADVPEVSVGGADFFGILGSRMHYALYGDANSALDPSLDLPQYSEGEFFDMATGLIVQLFNEQTATKAMNFGDQLAFCPSTITTGNNPLALPYGALISVPAGNAAPTGFVLIPNARIITVQSLAASAAGTLVLANGIVQLTQ